LKKDWRSSIEGSSAMNSQIIGLRVASVVFGLIALVQLLRLVIQPDIVVAGHHVPLWPSGIALAVLGSLSAWLWSLTRSHTQIPVH
jgi:hypothetical protein